MKTLLASLLLALLMPGFIHRDTEVDTTVLVQSRDDRSEHGSGVVIGRAANGNLLVLTARHVAIVPHLRVVFYDGRGASDVVRTHLQPAGSKPWAGDVAILETRPADGVSAATVASRDATPGTSLRVIGNPFDHRFFTSYARSQGSVRVRWLNEREEDVDDGHTQVGVPTRNLAMRCVGCAPGDSGGGVFDSEGKLVGIMYGVRYASSDDRAMMQALTGKYIPDIQSTAYVVPISSMTALLKVAH